MLVLLLGLAWADPATEVAALAASGCHAAAELTAREHLALDPDDPDRWVLLARTSADRGEVLVREALRLDPDHADAWAALGDLALAAGDRPGARHDLDRALDLDPGHIGAWLDLVALDPSRAAEATAVIPAEPLPWRVAAARDPSMLPEALAHHPNDPVLRELAATEALLAGRPETVHQLLDGPVAGRPRVEGLLRCLEAGTLDPSGLAELVAARRHALAGELVDLLDLSSSQCAAAWAVRASLRAADTDGRLHDLTEAVRLDPSDGWLHGALGLALLEAGRPLGAREHLARARIDAVDDATLRRALAAALEATGHPDDAALRLAVPAADPVDAELLAGVHLRRGHPERALDTLVAALERNPCHDRLRDLAGPLAEAQGRDLPPTGLREPPPLPRAVDPEVDEVVVVTGESEVERLRAVVAARLAGLGYGEGRVRNGLTVFRPVAPILPVVELHDDGLVEVQEAGLVTMPDGEYRMISERKMAPRRRRILEAIWPDLIALQQALATAEAEERVGAELPDRLDALWHDGVPLTGTDTLSTPAERRAALLEHWSTRTCTPEGALVRALVATYVALEVQESAWPATAEELSAAEARSPCGDTLLSGAP